MFRNFKLLRNAGVRQCIRQSSLQTIHDTTYFSIFMTIIISTYYIYYIFKLQFARTIGDVRHDLSIRLRYAEADISSLINN